MSGSMAIDRKPETPLPRQASQARDITGQVFCLGRHLPPMGLVRKEGWGFQNVPRVIFGGDFGKRPSKLC